MASSNMSDNSMPLFILISPFLLVVAVSKYSPPTKISKFCVLLTFPKSKISCFFVWIMSTSNFSPRARCPGVFSRISTPRLIPISFSISAILFPFLPMIFGIYFSLM